MVSTLSAPTDPGREVGGTVPGGHAFPTTPGQTLIHGSFGEGRGQRLAVAAGCRMLHQVTEALVPVAIGVTVDQAIAPGNPGALLWCLAGITLLFMVLTFSWRIGTRLNTSVFSHGEHSLRQLLVGKVLDPLHSGAGRGPGRLLSISTSDTRHTAGLSWVVTEQLSAFAALLTAAVALVLISWQLGATVLLATAAFMLLMHLVTTPLERRAVQQQAAAAESAHVASDLVTGLRVLKGIGAVDGAARRYRAASRSSLEAALSMARAKALFTGVSLALSGTFLAAIACLASTMAANGTITVGQLVTVVGLAQFIKDPMTALAFLGAEIREKRAVAGRLSGLFAEENDLDQRVPGTPAPHLGMPDVDRTPGVARGLSVAPFAGSRFVMNLDVGSITGVTASPANARRLIELLTYQRPLTRGELSLHGRDATDLGPEEVARMVFVSDHDGAVFSASVRDNLATDTVDTALLAASGLDEVLRRLPAGLDSRIGEHGRTLSGGQRQRLLLGRALHQPQPVLVLHEPTSAVDSVTEARIAESLGRLRGRPLILITGSPALLGICDSVVDLDAPQPGNVHGSEASNAP
ncbi:ABC transporter ATP-binding protein [Arthrobacter sp. GMC3]|uniref:ABC transporter transmembrane domain-containing protein n=1 Tax=Arthrobacter sp. GMC3 TaxID=2058894 RepID=UPI0015E3F2EE|nr:ABC transporter ATP-binding protein [Arthrobacter sp. GMC3]